MSFAFEELLKSHREAQPPPDRHPDAEDLIAFAEDRLEPEKREEIRNHLKICRDCGDLVLALMEEAEASQDQSTQVAFERVIRQVPEAPTHAIQKPQSTFWPYATAATFFIAVIGWSLFFFADGTTPVGITGTAQVGILQPEGQRVTRGSDAILERFDRKEWLVLQLSNTKSLGKDKPLEAILIHQESGQQFTIPKVDRQTYGVFVIVIPPHQYEPGNYSLNVKEVGGPVIATYKFAF
jgi:hypothetical protein